MCQISTICVITDVQGNFGTVKAEGWGGGGEHKVPVLYQTELKESPTKLQAFCPSNFHCNRVTAQYNLCHDLSRLPLWDYKGFGWEV